MLALASIHEKGLVNENMKNGGLLNMGAVERTCSEPDMVKAFPYYDKSRSQTDPYALYKLGYYMEIGQYGHGYRGSKSPELALGLYKQSA